VPKRWLIGACATALLWAYAVPGYAQEVDTGETLLERVMHEQRITGWMRLDYFQSSNSFDDLENFFGATLQIKALPQLSESLDGKVEARLSVLDVQDRQGHEPRSVLLEGYVTMHFGRADLRIGKQIVAWGRTDGINPTDNLTPRNYSVLLPLEEDQRFGTWAARLNAYLSEALTLTVFISPFFEPDEVPLPETELSVETRRPDHALQNTEIGIKLDKSSDEFDCSVSYYHGYDLLPTVNSAGSVFNLGYDRMDVLGTDFARNFGRFGFRSELAYSLPSNHESVDPNASRPRLFWVAGIDRTFLENLNLNLQFLLHWMPDRRDPARSQDPMARGAGTLNGLIRGQEGEVSPGITFRVSDLWLNDTLRAELFGVINATRGDHYLRPLVSYDVNDQIRVSLGANLYAGPVQTQYGILKSDSGAFAEVRYGF